MRTPSLATTISATTSSSSPAVSAEGDDHITRTPEVNREALEISHVARHDHIAPLSRRHNDDRVDDLGRARTSAELTGPPGKRVEALDKRAAAGFTHVIDVPYEFESNSRDTLIVLRRGYRREPPDWNDALESDFTYKGMHVKIANANGGDAHKTDALEAVARAALDGWLMPAGPAAGDGSAAHLHSAALGDRSRSRELSVVATHAHASSTAGANQVVADDSQAHTDAAGAAMSARRVHADGPGAELASVHDHDTPGAGSGTRVLMMLAGAVAVAAGVTTRRRSLPSRALFAGVGVQLTGLGWDVRIHARAGEGVHLLENAGHWLALVGLGVTVLIALVLTRPHAAPELVTTDAGR